MHFSLRWASDGGGRGRYGVCDIRRAAKGEDDIFSGKSKTLACAFFKHLSLLLGGDVPRALPSGDFAGAFAKCASHRTDAAE
ncbi:hypothetical protein A8V01_19270 [Novosphingobium guangzhouense]|uniref:Uncharacterized protein n=1 Tax=Novosphingobium guangzhouense TaxID=1850347 RepID=A0A2K2G0I4_9SPHN|nr:hypothetical protein A8V01_19270 [Novosphingobium guangzhouense]